MFSVANFLCRAKSGGSIVSDYRLAKVIGITQYAVSNYRPQKTMPDARVLEQLCALSGDDVAVVMAELNATPLELSKFLKVTERSVWRWLADDSAPYAVLAALWHETPRGREVGALDVGNALNIERGLSRANGSALAAESAKLTRLLAICETGAANDPIMAGPPPGGGPNGFSRPARSLVHQAINSHMRVVG